MANPLDALAEMVADLETRVGDLEGWRVEHSAEVVRRDQEIDQIRQVADRERFLTTLRRGRR